MGAVVPLITAALPYIVPAVTALGGWIGGWFHHKHVVGKSSSTNK